MATLIQTEKVNGKTIRKMVFDRDWDTQLEDLKSVLGGDALAEGAIKTFSINKRGDRAVERIKWPDGEELLNILKK